MPIHTAIMLSAGKGTRLLPLTADRPKCLVPVGGKLIVDHHIDALTSAGVERRVVVGGYRADRLAEHLAARGGDAELRFNPFWAVASSISSVWAARDLLVRDFAIINGDTVYDPGLLADAFALMRTGINLVVEPIVEADDDDMLVQLDGDCVAAVSKSLDPSIAGFRSLGIVAAIGDGAAYRAALDRTIAGPDGIHAFHHGIVHDLAQTTDGVHAVVIAKGHWAEIDRPDDIENW
jgi:choline kinase